LSPVSANWQDFFVRYATGFCIFVPSVQLACQNGVKEAEFEKDD